MICKFCGNEIDDNSDFCFICGQKVEAQQPVAVMAEENVNDVYSQPEVQQTVDVQPATNEAPVYQQPVAPVQSAPVAAQPVAAAPVETKKKGRKEKDPSVASKAVKFFSFLFALIGLLLYRKAKKSGYEQKANTILNSLMTGVCVKLAIINIVLAKKYIF